MIQKKYFFENPTTYSEKAEQNDFSSVLQELNKVEIGILKENSLNSLSHGSFYDFNTVSVDDEKVEKTEFFDFLIAEYGEDILSYVDSTSNRKKNVLRHEKFKQNEKRNHREEFILHHYSVLPSVDKEYKYYFVKYKKQLYNVILIILCFCFGIVGYVYFFCLDREYLPPVIRAGQEEIKKRHQIYDSMLIENKSPVVYKYVEGIVEKDIKQENLIDDIEYPINFEKLEQSTFSGKEKLDHDK